jgi:hypothetical protein
MSRRATLGIAVLLCISAFTVVTAAAAAQVTFVLTNEACTGGTKFDLCYEGLNKEGKQGKWELSGLQIVAQRDATNVVFKVPAKVGTTVTIECKKLKQGVKEENRMTQTNPLWENSKTTGTLSFEECAITAPKADVENCTIPAAKETTSLSGELTSETNLRLAPKAGGAAPVIEIPFANKGAKVCVLKGTKKVTGFQDIEIINAGVAEKTKQGKAKEESGLKFGEETASLSGELEMLFPGLEDNVYVSKVA